MGSLIIPLSFSFIGLLFGLMAAFYFVDPYGSITKFLWQCVCYMSAGGMLGLLFGFLFKGILHLLSLL